MIRIRSIHKHRPAGLRPGITGSGASPAGPQSRRAFTIIELLIVVSILLLLTTFTIIAVDFTFEAERVSAGARQVQSMIAGARDRAIRARKPIGVKFVVDQDPFNGRVTSSMVYVGASDFWSHGHITLKRPDFDLDGVADEDRVVVVEGDAQTRWDKLKLRGFLGVYEGDTNGNGTFDTSEDLNANGVQDLETPRIRIPGDKNGTWYRVQTHLLANGAVPIEFRNSLLLVNEFRDPGTTNANDVIAFEGTGYSTYLLELPPRVLPDAEPVLLPDGVVIDLDGSQIPTDWRPAGGGHAIPCSSRMDLMFSPRGTIIGGPAGLGTLHFYICRRSDVQLAVDAGRAPVNGSDSPIVPGPVLQEDFNGNGTLDTGEDLNGNGVLDTVAVGDRSLVSIFTSTGKVASYPLNATDADNNGALDDPFEYAERGEATSQ